MKLIISICLVLAAFVVANNAYKDPYALQNVIFNTAANCSDHTNPCDWSNPSNWIGGIVPTYSSSVTIDYSSVNPPPAPQYINIGNNTSAYMASLNINGPNVELSSYSTMFYVYNTISVNNAHLVLNMGNLYAYGPFNLLGNSTFLAYTSFLNANGSALIDTNAQFHATHNSGVNFDKSIDQSQQTIVFRSAPIIDTMTGFSVAGPNATFLAGINADTNQAMVFLNTTYLYGTTSLQSLRVLNTLTLMDAAVLNVANQFYGLPGCVVSIGDGALTIGNGDVTNFSFAADIQGTVTSSFHGTLLIQNFPGTISIDQVQTMGSVSVDNVYQFNIGSDMDPLQSNLTILNIAGTSYFQIDTADIALIAIGQSASRLAQLRVFISFTSTSNIGRSQTPLNNTIFNVLDGAVLTMEGELTFYGTSGIYLYGEMTILNNIAFDQPPALSIQGGAASLRSDNVTLNGTVTMIAGTYYPVQTTIVGDFDQIGGMLHFAGVIGENLVVMGDFTSTVNGTIAFTDAIQPDSDSVIMVEGQVSITDNLLIQFLETTPQGNVDYYIMSSLNNPIQGMFSFADVAWEATKIIPYTYEIYVTNPANEMILSFKAPPPAQQKHLPGWAVFLIVLAVLTVVGLAFLGFRYYRRNQGYIAL
ncbi:hypothetical protein SAMD00019534_051010 [Acytostelium subglobosum LB1]|uniref:hypothetical protein n=1 Tax=Acytostelium subglobosum LB1 TaxID=1410327 RepID=UPI00064514D7|nr:hypothetical protein SAMD00019534_051010 [Acytostelium subglobosum LB1]GAM21926.1 hypothetical protein SAMD00019534_051010 [Acytostelium subglobosum LB1]|eukprot:XP_012755026.1 hypothetical protein SAMD00019534_051010 [Acytostelium subglobosum LB1]